MLKTIKIRLLLLAACLVAVFPPVLAAAPPPPPPPTLFPDSLQVLHWWTSDGERKAANVLIDKLAEQNIQWRDIAIPGGAGTGASKVLKSMVLAGHAPDVTQLNGVVFGEWADLGLLLELDAVAGGWKKRLFPTVLTLINNSGHFVAVPLGIHRINNLYYNRAIFTRLGLTAPTTWAEFEMVAERLRQAGITPLAQSAQAWQLTTLFETMVLADTGPVFYRQLFVDVDPRAFADPRLLQVLLHFRGMRQWMAAPVREREWTQVTHDLADGDAAMLIMGDWVKGELNAWGLVADQQFGCTAVPGSAEYHLYSVDTLAMFAGDYSHQPVQEALAQIAMSPGVQNDFNHFKGSIPVWRAPDTRKMDRCSLDSFRTFSKGAAYQVPSLAHRMAADEVTKDAIEAEVRRFFVDDRIAAADAQRRLVAMARALSKTVK